MSKTQKQTTVAKKLNRKVNLSVGQSSDRIQATSRAAMPDSPEPANSPGILSPPPATAPLASGPTDEKPPARPNEEQLRKPQDEFEALYSDDPRFNLGPVEQTVRELLAYVLRKHPVSENYRILLMYGNVPFEEEDAEQIDCVLTRETETTKPIALIVHSPGGDFAAGYQISELCREFSPGHFITAVPRQAKTAAMLVCCGADEIHLGSMSEFGPMDPQAGEISAPALAFDLKNAVEALLDLAGENPQAADTLAKEVGSSMKLTPMGCLFPHYRSADYNEGVAQSAKLYKLCAEHLLKSRKVSNGIAPESIATTLVYGCNHKFVFDMGEAASIFGPDIIIANSAEYNMANALYLALSMIESAVAATGCRFALYGSPETRPTFFVPKSKHIGQTVSVNT